MPESRENIIIGGVDKYTPVAQAVDREINRSYQLKKGIWVKESAAFVNATAKQVKARSKNTLTVKKLENAMHRVSEQQKINELTSRKVANAHKKGAQATSHYTKRSREMRLVTGDIQKRLGVFRNQLLLVAFAYHTIQRFVVNLIKTYSEFEQGLVNIQVMMEKDAIPTMAIFRKQIEDLAKSYGMATSELTQSMFDTYSATQDVAKSQAILAAGTKLAVAGNAKLSSTVKALITLMEAYGKQLKGAEDAWHLLFAMQVKARATVAELSNEVGKFLPLAEKLDISAEEIGASYSRLTVGLGDVSEAATAMRGILTALFKPSKELQALSQREYGMTIQRAVAEKGLIDVLTKLEKLESSAVGAMVGRVRALTGLVILTSNLNRLRRDAFDLANRTVIAEEALNDQLNTTQRQMKILGEHWRAYMRSLGEVEAKLMPLEKLAALMTTIAEKAQFLAELSKNNIRISAKELAMRKVELTWWQKLIPFYGNYKAITETLTIAQEKLVKVLEYEMKIERGLLKAQRDVNDAMLNAMPLYSGEIKNLGNLADEEEHLLDLSEKLYEERYKTQAKFGGKAVDLDEALLDVRIINAEREAKDKAEWQTKYNKFLDGSSEEKIKKEMEYHQEILDLNVLNKKELEDEEERHIQRISELGGMRALKWRDIEKKTTEFRIKELQLNYDRFLKMGEDEVDVTSWYNEEMIKIISSSTDKGLKLFNDMFDSIQKSMSDVFLDMLNKDLKTAEDYWRAFANSIKKLWADLMSTLIIEYLKTALIKKAIGGFMGGGIVGGITGGAENAGTSSVGFAKHGGTIQKNRIQSYQEGGEIPILAHEGEGVLSKKGMAALGSGNLSRLNKGQGLSQPITNYLVIQTIDAQSFREKLAENSDLFTSTIYGEIEGAYPLRDIIRRLGT